MRKSGWRRTGCVGLLGVLAACSGTTEVSKTELADAVERDAVAFEGVDIPGSVVRRLASNRLVIVGETHLIREHGRFLIALLDSLYQRGFRQVLLESPHMVDWLVDEYVAGATDLDWEPPGWFYNDLIHAVRDFNAAVPSTDRIRMRSIDVNLDEYGGGRDFLGMVERLSRRLPVVGPLQALLAGPYDTPAHQMDRLEEISGELVGREAELRAAWGDRWYDQIRETMEVEQVSVQVRAERQGRYNRSVRRREDEMKRLTDVRLRGTARGSLLNVGGNHAQKERLKGTDQEWLGDYLVHESTAVGGPSIVLGVTAAEIVSAPGSTVPDWSVLDASPDNEIWRLMHEAWPERTVFLPLDDPVFQGAVRMNFEGIIHTGAPRRHYDALLMYPVAHRIPQ